MTPDDRDLMMARLLAVWPTPKMPDPTYIVWCDHFQHLDGDRARRALGQLERESDRRPSIAKFHEAYGAARDPHERVLPPPPCGICEDGFVDLTPEGGDPMSAHRTYGRCPNGCLPMTSQERASALCIENERWERDRWGQTTAERRAEQYRVHDPAEPREREKV